MSLEVIAGLRSMLNLMADTAGTRLRSISGLDASLPDVGATACPACGGLMRVQKTVPRRGETIRHGRFRVREKVLVCDSGCRKSSGAALTCRPSGLADELLPRSNFGYDVMTQIGLLRFVHFSQREEIRRTLAEKYGVTISTGEISTLAKRFLGYLERLHRSRAPALRAALEADGGWPMHVDATCEDGRGTLLVVLAGWRRWVLVASKIPTESAESIGPLIEKATSLFGMPCAAMRDLGRAVIKALTTFKSAHDLKIPILSCHLHFLADIGRDLIDKHYRTLRNRLRHHAVQKGLRALARDIGKKIGNEVPRARTEILEWQEVLDTGHRVPEGIAGLAVTRSLAQWVLDYGTDGDGLRFPFDQPHFNLYKRCQKAGQAIGAFLRVPPDDSKVRRALTRLQEILASVITDVALGKTTKEMEDRIRLFNRTRDALRLIKKPEERSVKWPPDPIAETEKAKTIRDVRSSLARLLRQLHRERLQRGPAQDLTKAIDTILGQFRRHRRSLWGHAIQLPKEAGGGIRLVNRTNNSLEGEFNTFKHGERRRSGRKNLTKDLEDLPAEAFLARNLTRSDYVEVLCGSLDRLTAAFAELDQRPSPEELGQSSEQAMHTTSPVQERTGTSLSKEDQRIVRTEKMQQRINSAARSRESRANLRA